MKHINITKPCKVTGLARRMITQESNNSGDQILTLKELVQSQTETYYKIIAITSRPEGNWMVSQSDMIEWSSMVVN